MLISLPARESQIQFQVHYCCRPGSMFYYHNPLSFPSGAPRLPSLELPFSSTQPCKNAMTMLLERNHLYLSLRQPCKIQWQCCLSEMRTWLWDSWGRTGSNVGLHPNSHVTMRWQCYLSDIWVWPASLSNETYPSDLQTTLSPRWIVPSKSFLTSFTLLTRPTDKSFWW